jgi:rare lipoprotein A
VALHLATVGLWGCAVVGPGAPIRAAESPPRAAAAEQTGLASWYGLWHRGRVTASGEIFDPGALTAAHRTLPFGTQVRVTNLDNGRQVSVRITDRGPYWPRRIIDLSREAAHALGMVVAGVAPVHLEVIGSP